MADSLELHKSLSTAPLLPPGFLFHPTSQQIFSYYLHHKNRNSDDPSISLAFSVIPEIDLYNYDPSDLPQTMCFPYGRAGLKRHWYCFTTNAGGGGGGGTRRKGKGGVWKRRDRGLEVLGGEEGAAVLGRETTFLFHSRDCSSNLLKMTDWVLIEYALVDQREDSFVLCRVFFEPQCGNKAEEQLQDCCAKDNIDVTHNISKDAPCKQHDGASIPGIVEVAACKDVFTDTIDNNSQCPLRLTGEPDNQIVGAPLEVDRFKLPMSASQPTQLDQQSDGSKSGGIKGDDAVAEKVSTDSPIPEDDYIEINDLISPLLGIDSSDIQG